MRIFMINEIRCGSSEEGGHNFEAEASTIRRSVSGKRINMTQNLTPHEQLVQRFIDEALHTQNEEDEDDSRLMTGKND